MAEYDNMSKYKCPKCRLQMELDPHTMTLNCECGQVIDYKLYRLIRDIIEISIEKVNEELRRVINDR